MPVMTSRMRTAAVSGSGWPASSQAVTAAMVAEHGLLKHNQGIISDEPGLYVVGLPYQRSITSPLLGGVGADAKYVVDQIVSQQPDQPSAPSH